MPTPAISPCGKSKAAARWDAAFQLNLICRSVPKRGSGPRLSDELKALGDGNRDARRDNACKREIGDAFDDGIYIVFHSAYPLIFYRVVFG